jgi:acylpyruvate hydrolase
MPFASYEYRGRHYVGRVEGDSLLPLAGPTELGTATPTDVLAALSVAQTEPVPVADVKLRPVVPRPDKVICVGLNYLAHVGETGRDLPEYPVFFTKFASALIGAYDDIVLPPESDQVDFEGELAVVIGRAGRRISRDDALDHVLGFTVANDVTMRDYQYKTHQWLQGKAWDHSTPLGPYLYTTGEIDVSAVGLRTVLNGVEMQSSDTSRMIFDIPRLISTISEFTELTPGDVILTGTPGGVGFRRDPKVFLREKDEIVIEIEGLGSVVNRVVGEATRANR